MRHSNAALVREWSCTQFWERNSPKNGLSCCIICSKIHSFTCAVSRTQYARCLKINDASIYRIQSMIESGDKYNSNPLGCMYSCMCVCAYFSARTTAATRSSVFIAFIVPLVYIQAALHNAFIQYTFVFLCVTT